MTQTPRIMIIYTGGTIGMIENQKDHTLQPFNFDHLMENVPKIKMLDYDITNFQFQPPIDSSNMSPAHWDDMARVIEDNYEQVDGFVVLHGTDTMAYTASALSFMLGNLQKPVIITGSQLPIGEVRTDGEENLITALQVAAARTSDGKPMVREVAILFENYLWRGNRSTKRSADNFNAFRSPNYPELAHIGLEINFLKDNLYRHEEGEGLPLQVHYNFSSDVEVLFLFPGMSRNVITRSLETPGLKGVVLKTFGAGNAPGCPWFLQALRKAIDNGVVVVNVTQCPNGTVMQKLYATGDQLAELGCISGSDITTEAAITKLMYLFGQNLTPEEVKRCFGVSLRGEISQH